MLASASIKEPFTTAEGGKFRLVVKGSRVLAQAESTVEPFGLPTQSKRKSWHAQTT